MTTTTTGIGDRLRAARERAGLTQVQLAEKTGVDQTTISKIERGHTGRPGFDLVAKLAEGCGASLDALTAEPDAPAPVDPTADTIRSHVKGAA